MLLLALKLTRFTFIWSFISFYYNLLFCFRQCRVCFNKCISDNSVGTWVLSNAFVIWVKCIVNWTISAIATTTITLSSCTFGDCKLRVYILVQLSDNISIYARLLKELLVLSAKIKVRFVTRILPKNSHIFFFLGCRASVIALNALL
jgi:hypothetical protein